MGLVVIYDLMNKDRARYAALEAELKTIGAVRIQYSAWRLDDSRGRDEHQLLARLQGLIDGTDRILILPYEDGRFAWRGPTWTE